MLLTEGSNRDWQQATRASLCLVALVCCIFPHPAESFEHGRSLLTGFSYGKQLITGQSSRADAAGTAQPRWHHFQQYDKIGEEQHNSHLGPSSNRRLLQTSTQAPAPANFAVQGVLGKPDASKVYTIVNNNAAQYGTYVCIDACAHGNTCIWENAWLWQCNGTNPTHHYWVWEPDTGIIRSATTDSFQQNPEICLDMCTDFRYGNGACVMTSSYNVYNVGYKECTGFPNQQWEMQGTQIVNKQNGYCLSAGVHSCGRWSNCNKSQFQTKDVNKIINVYADKCDPSNISQQWTLGPAPNSTLIDFTPLNISASRYASPNNQLATTASSNTHQVINFVNQAGDNTCLSIENQASCQSSSQNGSNVILDPLSTVCVWKNALMLTCWVAGSDASADQQWVYDNVTKLIALSTDPNQNVCLEMCVDNSFANGACSLTQDNIGWASCTGAPEQLWTFTDGLLYNEASDMCINEQRLCMIDYGLFLNDPAAVNTAVDGYQLNTCLTNIKNGPWAALPYNGTSGPVGIRNLIGGPCDQVGNGTLKFTAAAAASMKYTTDPIAPGITANSPVAAPKPSSSNTGAIAGAVAGAAVFLLAALGLFIWLRRRNAAKKARVEYEEDLKKGSYSASERGRKLDSVDSDVLAPARSSGLWLDKLDLGDEINPEDITIVQRPDGTEWKLGEGAFGTVYKANRFGVQPVAVKVLREDSGKQIENFKREIDLLRGLRDNNIVLFLGACKKDGRLMLVTEFMPQGDLWNALNHSSTQKFLWYQRGKKIALDVARGLVHLHQRDIVHMDLKSPNILLGKDLTAKIADVGLARSVSNSYLTQMTSIGTMAWAAPELKRNFKIGKKEGPRTVTAKADVFSFGVVLWEIVTGEDPTFSSREVRVPVECPTEIESLIEACLGEEPEQRPDMKDVYERLRQAANIPPPGASAPIPTPGPTPPISNSSTIGPRSAPRSSRAAPKSADYVHRLGLAAALKKRLTNADYSGGGPKSLSAPKSSLQSDFIPEDSAEDIKDEKEQGASASAGRRQRTRPPGSKDSNGSSELGGLKSKIIADGTGVAAGEGAGAPNPAPASR